MNLTPSNRKVRENILLTLSSEFDEFTSIPILTGQIGGNSIEFDIVKVVHTSAAIEAINNREP